MNDDGIAAFTEFLGAAAQLCTTEKKRCPGRRLDDDVDDRRDRRRRRSTSGRCSPTVCCCWTAARRRRERSSRARSSSLPRAPTSGQLFRAGADIATATEEFIRWVSPIHNMCRVAAQDYELGGVTIKQGQQVVLMYGSANRDPAHFTDPERFDVTRKPNDHIAFGLGTHFCLGAGLARLEIRVFFEELVRRVGVVRIDRRPGRDAQRFRLSA